MTKAIYKVKVEYFFVQSYSRY